MFYYLRFWNFIFRFFYTEICNFSKISATNFEPPVPPLSISKNRKKYFQIFTPSFFEFFAILRNLTIKSMQFWWLAFPIFGRTCRTFICSYRRFYIHTHNNQHTEELQAKMANIPSYLLSSWNIAHRRAATASVSCSYSARSKRL